MTTQTGNLTHDTTVLKAQSVQQAAIVPGASFTTVLNANIALYRTGLASALANGVNTQCHIVALYELGTGGR